MALLFTEGMPPIIDILKLLHEGQAFEWGHIALTPDQHAEVWANLDPWLSQPELLKPLAWQLVRNMSPNHRFIDVLMAVDTASVPLAYEIATQLKKPLNWFSEQEKPAIPLSPQTHVMLVAELTRSGATLLQAASKLGACQLLGAVTLIAPSSHSHIPFPVYSGIKLPLSHVPAENCESCRNHHPLKEKWL